MWFSRISFNLLFLIILMVIQTLADKAACEKKERHLALLDLAKVSITKAENLQSACFNVSKDISTNSSECGVKEKVSAYLDIAKNLIKEAVENYSSCGVANNLTKIVDIAKNITKEVILHEKIADCSKIMENGNQTSGIYTIWPKHPSFVGKPLAVYCDMETEGGGWTVIQRRGQFSTKIDFFRNWNDYKRGFGNISEEFWIGNEKIFSLTNQGNYTLRFDLENASNEKRHAHYSNFWIEDEKTNYTLHYGDYYGTAGDGLEVAKNRQFSTIGRSSNCPSTHYGGWWYNDCGYSNPNGVNQPGKSDGQKSMFWYHWTKFNSLQAIEMKIRPESFNHSK